MMNMFIPPSFDEPTKAKEVHLGIHKLTEECGEVLQLLGKLGAFPQGEHPDGKGDLILRLEDELADLAAAIEYFTFVNKLNDNRIIERGCQKLKLFKEWGLSGIKL